IVLHMQCNRVPEFSAGKGGSVPMSDQPGLERRLRSLEGQNLALRTIVGALLQTRFHQNPTGARAEAHFMSEAIDRIYADFKLEERGDEVMQVALHTIEEL